MSIDKLALRDAFSCFATGVAVVTARPPSGRAFGITINSLTSLSLDPPLLLWNLRTGSQAYELWRQVDAFSVNILAADQTDLCWRYATADRNLIEDGGYVISASGVPRLEDCLAYYDCDVETSHTGGDHVINVGRVLAVECHPDRRPLVVFGGRLHDLDEAISRREN